MRSMALPLPSSLSPSKVSSFQSCALAFRFSAIDKLPEPPSEPAVKGTTVHRALELLMAAEPADRVPALATAQLEVALEEMQGNEEYTELNLDDSGAEKFAADAQTMIDRYFALEDPRTIDVVANEQMLEADIGDVHIRGIIDRLERNSDGRLVVSDYKTGRAPSVMRERERMGGVHFYAYLCREVYGELPAAVQLIYLGAEPQIITATPSEQSARGLKTKVSAVWNAVERACEREDFRPKKSPLCNWCSFQAFCPEFGGNPDDAKQLAAANEVATAAQPATP